MEDPRGVIFNLRVIRIFDIRIQRRTRSTSRHIDMPGLDKVLEAHELLIPVIVRVIRRIAFPDHRAEHLLKVSTQREKTRQNFLADRPRSRR